jgi:hypothetical protein
MTTTCSPMAVTTKKPADKEPAPDPLERIAAGIEAMRLDLQELREAFDLFSKGGFPLERTVATSELLTTLAVTTAVMIRDAPLQAYDLQQRIQAALVIGEQVLKCHDEYRDATHKLRLENNLLK